MDYIYVLFDCKGHVIACCTDEFLADQFTYSRGVDRFEMIPLIGWHKALDCFREGRETPLKQPQTKNEEEYNAYLRTIEELNASRGLES